MPVINNKGFEPEVIGDYKRKMKALGMPFLTVDGEENTDESLHFYFVGKDDDGKEVIYDAMMYTLRLQHESEMFEIAEHRAAQHFPNYQKITYEEDENGNLSALDDREEEIGLFMAEVILELEEEEAVRVSEHVDMDDHVDFGIALDIGLHVEKITPTIIEKFINDFYNDTLQLDTTLYTFQTKEEEA
jgi:hypothetical protein